MQKLVPEGTFGVRVTVITEMACESAEQDRVTEAAPGKALLSDGSVISLTHLLRIVVVVRVLELALGRFGPHRRVERLDVVVVPRAVRVGQRGLPLFGVDLGQLLILGPELPGQLDTRVSAAPWSGRPSRT